MKVIGAVGDIGVETQVKKPQLIHFYTVQAILLANKIDDTDFSYEVQQCLPSLPWTIPTHELNKRRDLRLKRLLHLKQLI